MHRMQKDYTLIRRMQTQVSTGANAHQVNNLLQQYVAQMDLVATEPDEAAAGEHAVQAVGLETRMRRMLLSAVRAVCGADPLRRDRVPAHPVCVERPSD